MGRPASPLETRLGHRFRDASLLDLALSPPSAGFQKHNQRLEFLGDALLNAAVALLIHRVKPDWDEGAMSKLRGTLVCTAALAEWAKDLGLVLKEGPRSPGTAPSPKTLADGVEALVAAVHEDCGHDEGGGFGGVLRLCETRFLETIRSAHPEDWKRRDAKTALQERAAALNLAPPVYRLHRQAGPDHAPRFTVEAAIGTHLAQGMGSTRKAAETEAAHGLLDLLRD